jgi:hypothetical protein
MTMLASQPMTPPMMSQMMKFMGFALLFPAQTLGRLAVV